MKMQLPVWLVDGTKVYYVYKDGDERMMEVYSMYGDESYFGGVQPCDMEIQKMKKLRGPWKDIMEERRRVRLQGIRDVGQPALF